MSYSRQTSSQSRSRVTLQRYERLQLLGRGTMGSVYAARDRLSGERVAVKVLHPHFSAESATAARFAREAKALRGISHPNVTRLIDVIDDGAAQAYVMELLDGRNLRSVLDHEPQPPLEVVYAVAMQMSAALEAIHKAGIVHRDVKPENVFCNRGPLGELNVKILDFGIAKVRSAAALVESTGAGTILGTPEYMAPEQVRGDPADERTDVYAFGAVLYEMLCGRTPLSARNIGELVIKLMAVTPKLPSVASGRAPKISPAVDDLVMRCLAKDPADRPESMTVVRQELLATADAMNAPTAIMHVDEIDAILRRGRQDRPGEGYSNMRSWAQEGSRVGA